MIVVVLWSFNMTVSAILYKCQFKKRNSRNWTSKCVIKMSKKMEAGCQFRFICWTIVEPSGWSQNTRRSLHVGATVYLYIFFRSHRTYRQVRYRINSWFVMWNSHFNINSSSKVPITKWAFCCKEVSWIVLPWHLFYRNTYKIKWNWPFSCLL